MSDGYACLDAHAYVDNSLKPTERAAFEAAMRRDSKLRARVDAWAAQNEAIRLAFGATPKPRLAPSVGRPSNENDAPKAAVSRVGVAQPPARVPESADAEAYPARVPGWLTAVLPAAAFFAAMLGFCGGPLDPREPLMQRATTALRATAPDANTRLDFISDDPRLVSAWLAPRFARLAPDRLVPPGWSLLGVRVVPGLESAAAFVLFNDDRGERAGLLLEPMDGLPDLSPIRANTADETLVAGAEQGFAYAAVSREPSAIGTLVPPRRGK
jgi:anti-sigma factor RsiW